MRPNALYYGDNLRVLREDIPSDSVDLVYLDPPFNSNATYNILFKAPKTGASAEAQIEAFEDTWHWGEEAARAFDEVMDGPNAQAAPLLRAMRSFLGENDMMAYLAMMAVRLIELHRVLKPTGSLYLHCDPTASHYLKLLLDGIFGPLNYRNEIVWKRTYAHGSAKRYGPIHDSIHFVTRSDEFTWTSPRIEHDKAYVEKHFRYEDSATGRRFQAISLTGAGVRKGESGKPWRGVDPTIVSRHWALPGAVLDSIGVVEGTIQDKLDALDDAGLIFWPAKSGGTPRLKHFADALVGASAPDVWTDIAPLGAQAQERLGYPTQKPLKLLERIVAASSRPGDLILDPFCGCGTAVHAAHKLERKWIGIDVTCLAISLVERRLKDAFPGIQYEVHGTPKTLQDALDLADRDKYQFQWWAAGVVGARPYAGKKKGADRGIDGILFFKSDKRTTETAIVSVKAGTNVGVAVVRDLVGVLDREKAAIGVLLTVVMPTRAMGREAAAAGFFKCDFGEFPRVQILTLADLFQGRRPRIPLVDASATFRTGVRESEEQQPLLDL